MRKRQKEAILISFLKEKQKYEKLADYMTHLIKDDPAFSKESLHTITYRIKDKVRLIEKIDEENKQVRGGNADYPEEFQGKNWRSTGNYDDKMNSQTLIKFMGRLIKDSKRKIFLILDNLKVHHSHLVKGWLKVGVHSGAPARTKDPLKRKAISHLRKLQKLPGRIKRYFRHPKITYAKAAI